MSGSFFLNNYGEPDSSSYHSSYTDYSGREFKNVIPQGVTSNRAIISPSGIELSMTTKNTYFQMPQTILQNPVHFHAARDGIPVFILKNGPMKMRDVGRGSLDMDDAVEVLQVLNGIGRAGDKASLINSIQMMGLASEGNEPNKTDRLNYIPQGSMTVVNTCEQNISAGDSLIWDIPDIKKPADELGRYFLIIRPHDYSNDIFTKDNIRDALSDINGDSDFRKLASDYRNSLMSLILYGSLKYLHLSGKVIQDENDIDIAKTFLLEAENQEIFTHWLFPSKMKGFNNTTTNLLPGQMNNLDKKYQQTMEDVMSSYNMLNEDLRRRRVGRAETSAEPGAKYNIRLMM